MIFVIGDIHGEFIKLNALIKNILELDRNPEFIFIGDYIDKGQKSLETLLLLKELNKNYRCRYILGNHEYYWLNLNHPEIEAEKYLTKFGGLATLNSFNASFKEVHRILINEFDFMFSHLENYIRFKQFLICHCGYLPSLNPISKMTSKNWIEVNRYNFLNWNNPSENYFIIFGHTAFYQPYFINNKIGIDTGACYLEKQPLTAYCLNEKMFIHSNNSKINFALEQVNICPMIIRKKIANVRITKK